MSKSRNNTYIITDKSTLKKNSFQYNKAIRQQYCSRDIIALSSEFNDRLSCKWDILY